MDSRPHVSVGEVERASAKRVALRAGARGENERGRSRLAERCAERLAPQARMRAPGRKLYFVLTGDGRVGGQAYRHYTTLFCERGEGTVFEAETPTEILVFGLPKLDIPAHYAIAAE